MHPRFRSGQPFWLQLIKVLWHRYADTDTLNNTIRPTFSIDHPEEIFEDITLIAKPCQIMCPIPSPRPQLSRSSGRRPPGMLQISACLRVLVVVAGWQGANQLQSTLGGYSVHCGSTRLTSISPNMTFTPPLILNLMALQWSKEIKGAVMKQKILICFLSEVCHPQGRLTAVI